MHYGKFGMHSLSFYNGKKVFITGHTGFKGTWLSRILLAAGADVAGFSLPPAKPSLFELTQTQSSIRHITGDIRNVDTIKKAVAGFQPEIVFHLAAQPLVRLSYAEPVMTFETNVMGTVNILEAVPKPSHTVCKSCGYYDGNQVIDMDKKDSKKA